MKILFVARSTLFDQPGGDTIQIEETAKHLRELGHHVDIHIAQAKDAKGYDFIHFFNLIRPAQFLPYLKSGVPIVCTSIYVDYSGFEKKYGGGIRKILLAVFGKFGLEYFKVLARWIKGVDQNPGMAYLFVGQKRSIKKILKVSSKVICASQQEINSIQHDFQVNINSAVVNLGSEHVKLAEDIASKSGIACVARIEGLKNQLSLIEAVKELNIPLSIIGKAAQNQKHYLEACKKAAGNEVYFKGHLEKNQVFTELQKTQVHAMVSFYETTGLSTIEALRLGNKVVISEKGGQKEIFKDHAFYADPENIDSIKGAIQMALQSDVDHSEWVQNNFSWAKAAREISDIYHSLQSNP